MGETNQHEKKSLEPAERGAIPEIRDAIHNALDGPLKHPIRPPPRPVFIRSLFTYIFQASQHRTHFMLPIITFAASNYAKTDRTCRVICGFCFEGS